MKQILNALGTITLVCLALNAVVLGYAITSGFNNVAVMSVAGLVMNFGTLKLVDYSKKTLG